MFSRFHIEGRYEDEVLILMPVAVKTKMQKDNIFQRIYWNKSRSESKAAPSGLSYDKKLEEGALNKISGQVEYSFYETLYEG